MQSILPFTPTYTDQQIYLAQSYIRVPILDVDPKRIVTQRIFPESEHEGLADLMTILTSEEPISKTYRRKLSTSSIETDFPTSSGESKSERVNVSCLHNLIKATLFCMGDLAKLPVQGSVKPFLMCYTAPVRFEWTMAGVKYVAVNDGSIGVNFPGNVSLSNRKSAKPVVNLEEVAELIGSIAAQKSSPRSYPKGQKSFLENRYRDQETLLISMHRTLFYISTAYFSPEYIQYMEKIYSMVGYILIRSAHFDLKNVEQRVQALELLRGLISYVASGEEKVDIVAAAIEATQDSEGLHLEPVILARIF
ncbi:uncharacterized protein BDW43DRAFT_302475 [Aspergillus alliaceus]|uniref:uncharacterized protein n=1 Tax=Petromyces alliaceus TaxID=209559 RepID=UPI0012A4CCCE|nr:uncharacterized protein BDW43DRAFT_302475 [Aspergillus alliaceus]KAB8230372.1 hypothetical protein BDW43DRAFT_302475 [Aspergillus alliaceus]